MCNHKDWIVSCCTTTTHGYGMYNTTTDFNNTELRSVIATIGVL